MAKNDITGDNIKTRASNQAYRDNWDRIFNTGEATSYQEKTKGYQQDDRQPIQTISKDHTNITIKPGK